MLRGVPALALLLALAGSGWSQTCGEQLARADRELRAKYGWEARRAVTLRVRSSLTPAERDELLGLSARFNSIAHDTPEHAAERYALQGRARALTRAAVARAGWRVLNPETGDPFDALIGEQSSADGYREYLVEVRALLIFADPLPHVTLWLTRWDPAHNPGRIVTAGIMGDPARDYMSWRRADQTRISGAVEQYLRTLLPEPCRTALPERAREAAESSAAALQPAQGQFRP